MIPAAPGQSLARSIDPWLCSFETKILNRCSWVPVVWLPGVHELGGWVRIGYGATEVVAAIVAVVYHIFKYISKEGEYAHGRVQPLIENVVFIGKNYALHGVLNIVRGVFEKIPFVHLLFPIYDGFDLKGWWEWTRLNICPCLPEEYPSSIPLLPCDRLTIPLPETIGGMARLKYDYEDRALRMNYLELRYR